MQRSFNNHGPKHTLDLKAIKNYIHSLGLTINEVVRSAGNVSATSLHPLHHGDTTKSCMDYTSEKIARALNMSPDEFYRRFAVNSNSGKLSKGKVDEREKIQRPTLEVEIGSEVSPADLVKAIKETIIFLNEYTTDANISAQANKLRKVLLGF